MIIFFILFLSRTNVIAGTGSEPLIHCSEASKIAAQVEFCEDSLRFVKEAKICNREFDREINEIRNSILGKNLKASKISQKGEALQEVEVLNKTREKLGILLLKSKSTIVELKAYLDELVYPEDSDVQEVTFGDTFKYAMSVECYGKNRKGLDEEVQAFQKRIFQVEGTSNAINSKEIDVSAIVAKLETADLNKKTKGNKLRVIPAKPPGNAHGFQKGGSGISNNPSPR